MEQVVPSRGSMAVDITADELEELCGVVDFFAFALFPLDGLVTIPTIKCWSVCE